MLKVFKCVTDWLPNKKRVATVFAVLLLFIYPAVPALPGKMGPLPGETTLHREWTSYTPFCPQYFKPGTDVTWNTTDILVWQVAADDSHLLTRKSEFVKAYTTAIKEAAHQFDIPEALLAGVAWREFGGDPMWIDDLAFAVRTFDHRVDSFWDLLTVTRHPLETSFGNMSIQVRRAAEVMGYGSQPTEAEQAIIIEALKDPVRNIFIAAAHLAELQHIDFPGKSATEITLDDFRIVATRYNRGPELTLSAIQEDTGYGDNILRRYTLLTTLLTDNKVAHTAPGVLKP